MTPQIRPQRLLGLMQSRLCPPAELGLRSRSLQLPQGSPPSRICLRLPQPHRGVCTSQILRQAQGASPQESTPLGAPAPPKPRRVRQLLMAATFLLIGTIAGSSLRLVVSPPTPPVPGTEEDEYTIAVLNKQAAVIPIVAELSADPSWTDWPAYASMSPSHASTHACAGSLAGSRGLGGYQRVFQNRSTGEVIVVVYFGPATAGWPGVVHGGCVATVLDETCGRAASAGLAAGTGVTAKLGIKYLKPTLANGFYVVRARTRPEEELEEKDRGKGAYKAFVDATVEDAASGQVCAVAEALFIGPKVKRAARELEGAMKEDGLGDNIVPLNHRF